MGRPEHWLVAGCGGDGANVGRLPGVSAVDEVAYIRLLMPTSRVTQQLTNTIEFIAQSLNLRSSRSRRQSFVLRILACMTSGCTGSTCWTAAVAFRLSNAQ